MFELVLANALAVLANQSTQGLILMFWYVLTLELPRYGLSIFALMLGSPFSGLRSLDHGKRRVSHIYDFSPRVSVVVAGLNEAKAIEKCVLSLRAQSFNDLEIVIVSDGSTDRMPQIARDLVRRGLADKAFSTDLRCGKSSGVNLAFRFSSGDIVINVDCDCSYDRFAIERIVAAFYDKSVGAACGDIVPRNGNASLIGAFQVIEYMICISLGKRVGAMLDQVVCASGAFSAFRREAIDNVGFLDPGGGEDLDVTLRLRKLGWRIAFIGDAICYTDVPTTSWSLIRQRMRWERDAVRVRYRKHPGVFMPASSTFIIPEAVHQIDFLLFNVLLLIAFLFYLLFLFFEMGEMVIYLLLAVQVGMLLLDACILIAAITVTGRWSYLRYLPFLPGYSLFNTTIMRGVRMVAYVEEWLFDASRRDSHYVPLRVQRARRW